MSSRPLVALSEALDHYFLLTRLGLGQELLRRGFRVAVLASETGFGSEITRHGFEFIPLPSKPIGLSPMAELNIFRSYLSAYQKLRPDWTHHFTPRPIVYGSMAARLLRIPYVNTITGLGYTFTDSTPNFRRKLTRFLGSQLFRAALGAQNCRTVVQNPDDQAFVSEQGWAEPSHLHLIRSSGVNCELFSYCQEPTGRPVRVVMPGRILKDKGIAEFVEACRWLKENNHSGRQIQMVLVGEPDAKHPTSVPTSQLQEWAREGLLEWAGFQSDMPKVFSECHVVVLPSYREGFPKALLEAAACGRPLVGADVPGVREIVHHRVNGLRVPVRDGVALAKAILELASSSELRKQMGLASRGLAESHSLESVVRKTFEIYATLPIAKSAQSRLLDTDA